MGLTRTITVEDISPQELAELFCDMYADEQAVFFAEIASITAKWPGAGWCQQSCGIADKLNRAGRDVIKTLADHAGLLAEHQA